jgi:LysM repeat protein
MATLHQQITEKFIKKLAESNDVDAEKVKQLNNLLIDGKKPKAEDFIKIFSLPIGAVFGD